MKLFLVSRWHTEFPSIQVNKGLYTLPLIWSRNKAPLSTNANQTRSPRTRAELIPSELSHYSYNDIHNLTCMCHQYFLLFAFTYAQTNYYCFQNKIIAALRLDSKYDCNWLGMLMHHLKCFYPIDLFYSLGKQTIILLVTSL